MKLFLLTLFVLSLSFTGNWSSQPISEPLIIDWTATPNHLAADTSDKKLNKAIRKTIRDLKRKKIIRKAKKELPNND